jgi:hypothetical protein
MEGNGNVRHPHRLFGAGVPAPVSSARRREEYLTLKREGVLAQEDTRDENLTD